ncbi:hypothetical protein ACHAWF_004474 [Thalassiosira exigua]
MSVGSFCLVALLITFSAGGVGAARAPSSPVAAPAPVPPPSLAWRRSFVAAALYPDGRDRPHEHEIAREELRYSGWRTVIRRSVSSPIKNSDVVHYDVIGQAHAAAVIVFAWNSKNKTATIVREYMPGPHRVMSGLAAGLVENGKHSSVEGTGEPDTLLAARYELEEECHLAGGTWYRLTEDGVSGQLLKCINIAYSRFSIHNTVPMDKYAVTEITPYLVIDPHHVPDPRPLDDEEDIEIITGVSAGEILQMIREGDFNLVGGYGALLALEKLRELGEIV